MGKSVSDLLLDVSDLKLSDNHIYNRIIFLYWDKGFHNSPDIAKLSFYLAKKVNPNYSIVFLDDESLYSFFPYKDDLIARSSIDITPQLFSDILRTYLLCKFGGIWVDTSALTLQQFDDWLEPIIQQHGYFIWKNRNFDDRQVMSWFIASKSSNETLLLVLDIFLSYVLKPRAEKLKLTHKVNELCPPSLIGTQTTKLEALNFLEANGYFPYFTYHYLWNEVFSQRADLLKYFDEIPSPRPWDFVKKIRAWQVRNVKMFEKNNNNYDFSINELYENNEFTPDVIDTIKSYMI